MIHMCNNTSRIKYLHERCLRLMYNNKMFSYSLNHQKNFPALAVEVFETKIGDIFLRKNISISYFYSLEKKMTETYLGLIVQ